MFPTPVSDLAPNTYAYETTPLVKPTGFREYDARWLFEKELNLMGVQALGLGLGTLLHEMGVPLELGDRPRLSRLFRLHQARADLRPDGGGRARARHRPRALADGLFRAIRAGCAGRRHGHRLAQ